MLGHAVLCFVLPRNWGKHMDRRPGLAKQIWQDLQTVGRIPLLLLTVALISALAVVLMTQTTRGMIAKQDQLLMEREQLEIEWRNQILEENALSEHSRVEQMARQDQQMVRPQRSNEVIVQQSNSSR